MRLETADSAPENRGATAWFLRCAPAEGQEEFGRKKKSSLTGTLRRWLKSFSGGNAGFSGALNYSH